MANKRILFSIQQVGFAKDGTNTFIAAHGVQNLGMTTNYNLEPALELGQLEVYQNLEQVPDVEITIEKALDGSPPCYLLATNGAVGADLAGRSNVQTTVGMSIFTDTQVSASGTPITQLTASGMFPSQIGYNFNVDGFFTENLTLLGTSKVWNSSIPFTFSGAFLGNNDTPLALASGLGGVQRRQNMRFTYPNLAVDSNGQVSPNSIANRCTVLPRDIPGISSSGTNDQSGGQFGAHVRSIAVSANLGREPIYELGRRFYYFRYVQFPVSVTCDIECTMTTGDLLNITEAGAAGGGNNLNSQTIFLATDEGLLINLGTNNKVNTITRNGGGVDGSNVTTTFSYLNFNSFKVQHLQDPTGL